MVIDWPLESWSTRAEPAPGAPEPRGALVSRQEEVGGVTSPVMFVIIALRTASVFWVKRSRLYDDEVEVAVQLETRGREHGNDVIDELHRRGLIALLAGARGQGGLHRIGAHEGVVLHPQTSAVGHAGALAVLAVGVIAGGHQVVQWPKDVTTGAIALRRVVFHNVSAVGLWGEDEFLTAFWGPRPRGYLAGETRAPKRGVIKRRIPLPSCGP